MWLQKSALWILVKKTWRDPQKTESSGIVRFFWLAGKSRKLLSIDTHTVINLNTGSIRAVRSSRGSRDPWEHFLWVTSAHFESRTALLLPAKDLDLVERLLQNWANTYLFFIPILIEKSNNFLSRGGQEPLRYWYKMQVQHTWVFCRSKIPPYLNSLVNVTDTKSSCNLLSICYIPL